MTETRRTSDGRVLGPRGYDPRSYDDRQAPTGTVSCRCGVTVWITGRAPAAFTGSRCQ